MKLKAGLFWGGTCELQLPKNPIYPMFYLLKGGNISSIILLECLGDNDSWEDGASRRVI